MIIVPFLPTHLEGFEIQDAQKDIAGHINREYGEMLSQSVEAYSGMVDGQMMACAGVMEVMPHRAVAWSLIRPDIGKHMIVATKEIKKFLDRQPYQRLETPVRRDFEQGHRWAQMLGFINETPDGMRYYGADGDTYDLYSKVK